MKPLLSLCLVFLSFIAGAQTIPNGDFETWNVTSYDEPNGWLSSNATTLSSYGIVTVKKATGFSSTTAIRLITR